MSVRLSLCIAALSLFSLLGFLGLLWWNARSPANRSSARWPAIYLVVSMLLSIGAIGYVLGLSGFTSFRSVRAADHDRSVLPAKRPASVKVWDLHTLARDGESMRLAASLFATNCSMCHGLDARGAKGFPNLTDADWQWGSDEAAILASISSGRRGAMPALRSALGEQGLSEVTTYVLSLSGRKASAHSSAAGRARFQTLCATCHGSDGKGNPQLGAPNLTDTIWLHGADRASIRDTIASGTSSEMPAQQVLLGATNVRLLAAYMLSISDPQYTSARPAGERNSTGVMARQASN